MKKKPTHRAALLVHSGLSTITTLNKYFLEGWYIEDSYMLSEGVLFILRNDTDVLKLKT